MRLKLQRYFFIVAISLLLVNCISVEKFNHNLLQPISVVKLQKDIDYTQHKLEKLYPNLYGYIPKEKLNAKFDSIRKVADKPMTSKEFYFVISPVIASVRQGHMKMIPVAAKFSKKEAKRLKKAGDGPLSQFNYEWQNDKMYIVKNKSKNKSIKTGSEVISVNNIAPQDIYKKYRSGIASDGFNTTYIRKGFSKRYNSYMTNEIGINDSLTFVFKQKDSLLTKVISRNKIAKKSVSEAEKKQLDTVKKSAKVAVDKDKLRKERERKTLYGYDTTTKEYVKSLFIIPTDSSIAVLNVKNFSQGKYKPAYNKLFDSIKKRNIKTLIIDLRDNPGGRIADAVSLYSYLTDKEFTMLQPAIVTSKTSLWKLGLFGSIPKVAYPFASLFYGVYAGITYFRTTKNSDGTYQYKLVGSKPKQNAANHFDGKIYVMINGGSFSASCLLSASLKTNPKVTFVGEETGGAFNGTVAGIMPIVKLPNSKIALQLGLMDIKTVNQTDVVGRGIFPDKEIVSTIEDKISKKDLELQWILNDIKKP